MTGGPQIFGSPSAGTDDLLADYREMDGLVLPSGTTGSAWAAKGLPLLPAGTRSWFLAGSAAGVATANTSYEDAAGPAWNITLGPATQAFRVAPQLCAPLWLNPALWPASFTRRLRYSIAAIVEASAPTSTEKAQFGFTNLGGTLEAAGPGQSGIQLAYDNGGSNTWRVRSRLTPLGALVLGNDSGLGAGVRFLAELRYSQLDIPQLEVLVNGQVLQLFTGVAALPVPAVLPAFPAAAVSGGFQCTYGIFGALGGNASLLVRQIRYTVETLAE